MYDYITETFEKEQISVIYKNGSVYKIQQLLFANENDKLIDEADEELKGSTNSEML